MRAFRRSEELELLGRQLGAKCRDRIFQLARRNGTGRDGVSQLFLEGERIGLGVTGVAARTFGSSGIRTATAGSTRAMIGPWRRQYGLQRAGVVAPGVELFAADADAGLERGQPGRQHEFRRRPHATRAKALRTMPHRSMRAGSRHRAMVGSILHCHHRRRLAGGSTRIGLCRQHGVNCGDGKQAERKKSASHDGVPFSHASGK
jgi:hypothetical protein